MRLTHLVSCILLVLCLACQDAGIQNEASPKEATPHIFKKTKKKTLEEKARNVADRWEYEQQLLRNPRTGLIPAGSREKSMRFARQASTSFATRLGRNSNDIVIEGRGPGNLGGRTRALAFDQRNANIILAGGISGGMFRTTNGGNSWVKVSPNDEIHNVSAVAQDPTNPDVWYYGTGENFGNSASASGATYIGQGVWRSADNGQTWTPLPSTQGGDVLAFDNLWDVVNRMVVHPTTGDVYAAANNAIFRSQNDGTSWDVVLGAANAGGFSDVIITPSGRVYAAFQGSDANEGVWTSPNGNTGNWTKIAGGGAATNPGGWNGANNYGRIVINYAPSAENIVYALYYNNTTSNCGGGAAPEAELFRWNLNTTSWTNLSANLPNEAGCLAGNDPFAAQGGYDLCVAVKPDNPNVVFIGGTNVYRSTNGFTSTAATTRIGGYVSAASYGLYPNHHPDIHFLTFAPGDNDNLYTGTDGGVHRGNINNNNVSWTSLNNDYVTYQYYHVDLSPNAGSDAVMGGAQDNGTTISGSGTTHAAAFGGDGAGSGLISYTNNSNFNMIAATQNGNLVRLNGPSSGFGISPDGATSSIFVTYFHLDQDNTNYLYYADGANLYRTRIASSITATTVTGNSASGWQEMTGVNQGSNIRAMATSRGTYNASDASKKLLIGLQNGRVYRLNDPAFTGGGTAPTDVTPAGSSGTVIGASISPTNDDEALVVYSNYGVNSVYHTTNLSAASPTWSNIEGAGAVQIASSRSCAIISDGTQTLYFVGTSTGLYCTDTPNGGATAWSRVGENQIGFAIASSLRYRPADQKMLVGTHGNGMFMLDIEPVFESLVDCSKPVEAACGGTYTADTASGDDNYTDYNGNTGWTGNEYVYEITTDPNITNITIDLTNTSAANLGVFLLSACDPTTVIASANANGGGGNEQILDFAVSPNTTYYIIIDGRNNATGTFDLAVTCTQPPSCTDGIQNGNETGVDCGGPDCPACPTCNDGIQNGDETGIDCGGSCPNVCPPNCEDGILNGDEIGIDCGGATCPPCAAGSCADPIVLRCGESYTGTTVGEANDDTTYNGATYGYTGGDLVFKFTITNTPLDITLTGLTGDLDLLLYDACNPGTATLLGESTTDGLGDEGLSTNGANYAAGTYYLFIDGYNGATSPFTLSLTSCTSPSIVLSPKVFLQGPLAGSTMNTDLTDALIPSTDPYNGGTSALKGANNTARANAVDWVLVEIRDANDPTIVLSSQSGLLLADGTVVDSDGVSPLTFPLTPDNYYVAVKHRNHLSVMTGSAIPLNN